MSRFGRRWLRFFFFAPEVWELMDIEGVKEGREGVVMGTAIC